MGSVGTWDFVLAAFLIAFSVGFFILILFLFSDWLPVSVFFVFLLVFMITLGFKIEYLAASVLALLFFIYAQMRLEHNTKNSIKLRFYPAILYGASSLVTAFAILFAFASYFYPFNVSEFKVSPKVFSTFLPIAEKVIESQMPTYQSGMTINDFLAAGAAKELGVSAKVIKRNYKTQLAKQRAEFAKNMGVKLSGGETLKDIMVLVSNSYINKYLVPNQDIVPIILSILVFLTIKSFGFILNRASVFFAWILFKILSFFKIVKKESIPAFRETLKI